jgi:DNA polymerase-3 subunit beta
MKIEVTQANLSRALAMMSRVASTKTELPILTNVLVATNEGGVTLSATNLEVAVTHFASAKISTQGKVAVPARLFHDFISQLPKDETISLVLEKNKLVITAGSYSSHIQSVQAEDFPALPQIASQQEVSIANEDLSRNLTKTVLAASHDETRPILGGVYVHSFNKKLYFVATDGYRLAEAEVTPIDFDVSAVVPAQALQEVLKMSQDGEEATSTLSFGDGQFAVSAGNTQLVSRLVDGTYPEYRKLIPETSEISFEINKTEFQTAAKLAGLFARESGGSITISASEDEQTVTIASVASQVGDNKSAVASKVKGSGDVVLNVRYLNDALNCFEGDEVSFRFGDSIAPCVLSSKKQPGYQHIVMPLKS